MDGQRHSENNHNIDVDKLTKEAEAGHGRYVGSILEQLPFEEQIHIAHEMEKLSKKHGNDYSLPQIEFVLYGTRHDEESRFGYDAVRLYRTIPDRHFGPLFGKSELVYENSVNLTTGAKTITESEINKK
jgi:hypothetical protein